MSDTSPMKKILKRAAISIGVNQTGGLTPLRAAASGAKEVADWLDKDGYDSLSITDEDEPVNIKAVKDAVRCFTMRGNLNQLVIYFAGHGYLIGTSEIWLLSGAPADPDEAVDLSFSAELARSSGIPSVVFISDACRSNPPTMLGSRVQGSCIFPNTPMGAVDVNVDRFFATKPGEPALELEIGEARTAYSGLFTEMLRRAHHDPDQSIIRSIRLNGQEVVVVPNRRLKEVLPARVNDAAQERSIRLTQSPQLRLECGEDSFVAQATFSKATAKPTPAGDAAQDLVKRGEIPEIGFWLGTSSLHRSSRTQNDAPLGADNARNESQTLERIDRLKTADRTGRFETQTGIQILGAGLKEVFAPQFSVTPDSDVSGTPEVSAASTRVRLGLLGQPYKRPDKAGSALVQFEDGGGAVIAVLPGYIASMLVEDGRVVNISYVPSENSDLWLRYRDIRDEVEHLRSLAAVEARSGELAVGRKEASRFGDKVRTLKEFDPTLGLYAAVSYAEIGLRSEVVSVQTYMRRDIHADLFDVALLAGSLRVGQETGGLPVVPFCPMLSQTWSFLRPLGVKLDPLLSDAFFGRLPSLWTTFSLSSVKKIRDAFERGQLL